MKKVAIILSVICLCFGLAACGSMTKDEPIVPIPKKSDLVKKDNQTVDTKEKKTEPKKEVPDKEQKADLSNIDALLKSMTLEEKVGQMFLARCPDVNATKKVMQYHLGGYILFGRDFKDRSKDHIVAAINDYQINSRIPMWIAVDEEGGQVNRVSRNPELRAKPFDAPQALYKKGGMEAIKADTKEKSELLLSLGINLNMAPVVDIPESKKDFIYPRSVSTDGKVVEEYAATMVEEMNALKIASVLKHFPGYGKNVDTHTEFAKDNSTLEKLKSKDLLPFIAGIGKGAGAVLISHNVITQLDSNMPASLSPAVHELLRKDLNFQGVIMTDDLLMDAVNKLMSEEEAAVQAVLAGNDMLCASSFEVQIPAVIKAVQEGKIKEEQIDNAVRRVLVWKQRFLQK